MSQIDFTPRPEEEEEEDEPAQDSAGKLRDEANDEMRHIMAEYLQPNSALSEEEAINRVSPFYIDDGKLVINFHYTVIDLADKIPYDHPSNKKLADFVVAFSKSDKWSSNTRHPTPEAAVSHYWGEMGNYLYDEAMEPPDRRAINHGDAMVYANMQAFLAELIWPDGQFSYFWAEVALRGVSGERDQSNPDPRARDAQVIGAAQYILRQAPTIYSESLKTRKPDHTPLYQKIKDHLSRITSRSSKERAPDFTWDRWQTWKNGFRVVAASDTYGQTCRNVAERAADVMALQEKAEDKTVVS